MILSVNHVGFSVKNIEDSLFFWTHMFAKSAFGTQQTFRPIKDPALLAEAIF